MFSSVEFVEDKQNEQVMNTAVSSDESMRFTVRSVGRSYALLPNEAGLQIPSSKLCNS